MSQKKNRHPVVVANKRNQVISDKKEKNKMTIETDKKEFISKYANHIIIAVIGFATFIFFKPAIYNLFTNWDDNGYVTKDNPLIKELSIEKLKEIFTTPLMGNYHPLTILSYAIEYNFAQLDAFRYHLDNLLFHIAVSIVVYWFSLILLKNEMAALIAALLFALHPMHVESVAWVSGRKDLLCCLFYIPACISYLYYLRSTGARKTKYYILVLFFFLCSLLSKPVAVALPPTLLLLDFLEKRKISLSLFIEKIPHFLLSIVFGIRSVHDQNSFGALRTDNNVFNFIERIALGSYAFVTYLWKAIIPVQLCCLYKYPQKTNGVLPFSYYLYPLSVLIIIFLLWRYYRNNRILLFGFLFFVINIALLLQFIPVGGAIIAERYTYIPYIGLCLIAGVAGQQLFERNFFGLGKIPFYAIFIYCIIFGFLSNERCKVWYDSVTLWRNEIESQDSAPEAYNNLGSIYFDKFFETSDANIKKTYFDSSLMLLRKAVSLDINYANPYINIGQLEANSGDFQAGKRDLYRALSFGLRDKLKSEAYFGLATIYTINQNYDSAAICYRAAIKLNSDFPALHGNFGNYYFQIGKYDSALIEYGIVISQHPQTYEPYLNRAITFQNLKRFDEALRDFAKAIEVSPDFGKIYYSRAVCYAIMGNKLQAIQDVNKARQLGFSQIDPNFYNQIIK